MGTRAQFFIGNPSDLEGREWLGCVAWDGYPDGDCGDALKDAKTEAEFRAGVAKIAAARDDFCDPSERSFPFPWKDDLYLTDCTYAWFAGAPQFTYFHRGFSPLPEFLARETDDDGPDTLPSNVAAPVSAKPPGPDSIMIVSMGSTPGEGVERP